VTADYCQPLAAHAGRKARGVSVTGAKSFLAACLVVAGALSSATAWAVDQLVVPVGGRVGIIVMLSTDITHYHVGKATQTSFMRTYRVQWPASEVVDDQLAVNLKGAGLEPVFLDPTELLRRQRQSWIVSTPAATKLPNAASEEITRIMTAENLQGLVIVAPGPNNNPDPVQGNRLRKLPAYVQGWGFSTSDEAGGTTKPVVFNLTQMLLIGKDGNSSEMVFREWGGGFVYEWATFDPGADLKALPQSEIEKFRPVIMDVMQRQIARLMPRVKVSG
jgi:hypothetical protein